MTQKTALIAGASGLVGRHCLELLLEEPAYKRVVAIVRTPLRLQNEKLVQQRIDFDELEIAGAILTADDVFCCLGSTIRKAGSQDAFRKVDFTYPNKLAALTQHLGASQFLLVSSLGADAHSKIFYNRVKGETEEAIRKISFNGLHIFRPSLLLGQRQEQRPAEQIGAVVMSVLKYALTGSLKRYRAIQARDVAKAMVRVAQMNLMKVNIFESDRIQELASE
jgi:uncharacterized protein YbjT (DUF2867 family)